MKKIILYFTFCSSLIISSCGKFDAVKFDDNNILSSTNNVVSASDNSSRVDHGTESAVETNVEISDKKVDSFDPVPVNRDIELAVEKNSPEDFNINGYFNFSYDNFNMVYSNEELEKVFDRLDDLCQNTNFQLAFSYENIESGATVNYNSYEQFLTCSTIKAPYIKSLLADNIDLNDKITKNYNWAGDTDDDDIVANMDNGKKFTAKELIEYAIIDSDNTAYMMLHDNYGYESFNNMQVQLGSNYIIGSDYIFTQATTSDMLKNYIDIFKFGESSQNGKWLIDLMKNASYNEQIGRALGKKYDVAQKYGADSNENAFNDCAICYADSPFVLCVFTVQPPDDPKSCEIFKSLAVIFDEINTLLCNKQ